MARVTVQDCIKIIQNRFELILVASERARTLAKGAEPLLERDRDKNPVVALREIADEKLDLEQTRTDLVKGLQKYHEEVLTETEETRTEVDLDVQELNKEIIEDVEKNADEAGLFINQVDTE